MKRFFYLLCGLCIGAADIIPGISGGTVAFILGIYPKLIESLRGTPSLLMRLLRGKGWRELGSSLQIAFLLPLLCGIGTALLLLAPLFDYLLHDEVLRTLLFALFFGLIVASLPLCWRQIEPFGWREGFLMALGALFAFWLTGFKLAENSEQWSQSQEHWIYPSIIVSGALAISAAILPGISGSYIMAIFGLYPVIIGALADLSNGFKSGNIDFGALFLLSNFAFGIAVGALCFCHLIALILKRHAHLLLAAMTGFIIGALRPIWPFQVYSRVTSTLRPEKGFQLVSQGTYLPSPESWLTWAALSISLFSFIALLLFERWALARMLIYSQRYRE